MYRGTFSGGICFLFFFISAYSFCFSQQKDPDSLINILRTQDLTQKERSKLLSLASHYHRDIDSALHMAKQSLQLAQNIEEPLLQAEALEEISHLERRLGNNTKSFKASFEALEIYESMELSERQAASFTQLASNYISNGDYISGINYLTKAMEIYATSDKATNYALTVLNLGEAYRMNGQLDSAVFYFEEALEMNETLDNEVLLGYSKGNLGMVQSAQNKIGLAQNNLTEAVGVLKKLGDSYSTSVYLAEFGKVHELNRKHRLAEEIFLEALEIAQKEGFKEQIRDIGILLSKFYEDQSQYRKALQYERMYSIYQDSLVNKKNIQDIERIKASYEIDKRESEIGLLNKINETQKYVLYLVMLGFVLLLIFAYLLRRGYKRIKRANAVLAEQRDLIAKKEREKALLLRELNHRIKNNLQMISSLLSLQGHQLEGHPAQEALLEGKLRVEALSLVHRKLYQDGVDTRIKVKEYMEELIFGLFHGYGATFKPHLNISDINITIDKAIPLALIINEVIVNALKYAYVNIDKPTMKVVLKRTRGDMVNVQVVDNGIGYASKCANENSFGIRLIHSLVEQLEGILSIKAEKGTCWNISMRLL